MPKRGWVARVLVLALLGLLAAVDVEGGNPNGVVIAHQDVGRLAPGSELRRAIVWTNTLDQTLIIKSISTSCDCLQVLAYDQETSVGKALGVHVRLAPVGVGPFQFSALIEGSGGKPNLVASFEGEIANEGPPAISPSRYVGAAELIASNRPGTNEDFIDVRPRERFLMVHIPGTLSLPLHELRGRSAFRQREILLLGDGHDSLSLAAEAATLEASGFARVRVLAGGVRAWQSGGGTLSGTITHSARAWTLPIGELMPLLGRADWLWLDVSASGARSAEPAVQMPTVVPCPLEQLKSEVQVRLLRTPTPAGIVLMDRDGTACRVIEELLSSTALPPRFYVEGGAPSLHRFLADSVRRAGARTVGETSRGDRALVRSGGGGTTRGCCGRGR